jgi:hypothetical protein
MEGGDVASTFAFLPPTVDFAHTIFALLQMNAILDMNMDGGLSSIRRELENVAIYTNQYRMYKATMMENRGHSPR